MSGLQIAYALALTALAIWRGGYAVWCLVGNLVAFLAVCAFMDAGTLSRDDATVWFAVIDFATGAALALRPGLARIVAAGYVVTVPLYALDIAFGISTNTTFAIVWAIVALQVGVVAIGSSGNHGGGNRRRHRSFPVSVSAPGGNHGMAKIGVAQDIALFSGRQ